MKLLANSDRSAGARRFGLELRRALLARGKTQRGFAAESGFSRSRLANWVTGASMPSVETADRVADLLTWPQLVGLSRAAREVTCDNCARVFVVESPTPRRYCSLDCQRFRAAKTAGDKDLSRIVMERRLRRYMAAVNDMCAACEPSGVCRTSGCPLQVAGVSPLPIARGAMAS